MSYVSPEVNYNYRTVLDWIAYTRKQEIKTPIKHTDISTKNLISQGTAQESQKIPQLFREILKIGYEHGIDIIKNAFHAITAQEIMSLQNLNLFIQGLGILCDQAQMQEFQMWLC